MKKSALLLLLFAVAVQVMAQNEIKQQTVTQTRYTADPAPMVYNDTVYLYTSHDEDDATGFKMLNWLLYTSTDMVNWTEHGVVASLEAFSWVRHDNGAWAVQCIERNGKFYLYCPMHGNGIGVLVSDSPYGPFKDPLGKRLIETNHIWNDIDPTVFIDDDGQAWLYWGNPDLYYVKLNPDMISLAGEVVKEPTKPKNYQEGPWAWKRKGHYYLAYASTCCPEGIGYAMSNSPTGPWEYKGMIVDASNLTRGNHPGIIDYKGKSYCFGHSYDLLKQSTSTFYERRSVDMDEMVYNQDGTIQNRHYWSVEGPEQQGVLNPFARVEAETMAWSVGVKSKGDMKSGIYIDQIHNGDYITVRGADFKKGAKSMEFCVSAAGEGASLEVRLDAPDGVLAAVLPVKSTGGLSQFTVQSANLEKIKGVHDLYFVAKGGEGELFGFDWWSVKKR